METFLLNKSIIIWFIDNIEVFLVVQINVHNYVIKYSQ